MTLPELSIRRPITTLVLLISILVIGGIAVTRLPLAFMPDIQENNLYVIADYPNASPKTIERLIIRPLEETLSPMNGIKHMWSRSDQSGGRVNLVFNWGVDMDMARVEIRERIDRVLGELPEDLDRIRISEDWNPRVSGETILEGRISSGRDLSKDYELLERKIIKPLERIPGVASVSLDGVNPREVKINLNLDDLRRHRIDAAQILEALRANNLDRSIGELSNRESRYSVRVVASFKDVEEIGALPIPNTNLRLRDVAEVTYREPPLEYGRHLDGEFAVGVSVTKESSANTVAVTQEVRRRVANMANDTELEGINFLVWEDQGQEITNTLRDLQHTGLIGAILASVILFLFLRRFSSTIIAVFCIPFSLIVACGVVWAQGKTLNTITLLGLIVGIGMLVDNAVVIMENIDRYRRMGFRKRVAALVGAREVSVAVIAATLTSVIVFLPMIFSRPSEMNIILRELALTVSYTLLASLFISQTLIPLASGWFDRSASKRDSGEDQKPVSSSKESLVICDKEKRQTGALMAWIQSRYEGLLSFTLKRPWLTIPLGLAVAGSVYIPYTNTEINMGQTDIDSFVGMRYNFSEDLPLEKKEEVLLYVTEILDEHRERFHVDSIYSYWSDRWTLTRLYMKEGYTTEEHMNEVRLALPDLLPSIPGLKLEVQDNGRPWQRNRGRRVAFQLQGPDTDVLTELADQAKTRLETIPGLFDVYSDAESGNMELRTVIDRDRAREYGIDVTRPTQVVELTFRGRRLPRFKGPDGEVEMRLTLDEQEVESLDQLKNLPMLRDGMEPIPLESFADFTVQRGPNDISRTNRVTSVWVGGRYSEGMKSEYIEKIKLELDQMDLPYGYSANFNAFRRQEAENENEFAINLILSLGLIFAVMAGLFESMRQALSLMISLPFAVSGAFWALYLTGTDFDQPASVGLLLLLGIVVNNGIVMIEHINKYRRLGVDRFNAMLRGGRERLRPILMTALTTLFGLIPMIVEKPSLGGMYYYSIAYVLMGGLLLSTILTTVFLPSAVCVTEDVLAWIGRLFGRLGRLLSRPFTGSRNKEAALT